MSDVRRLYVQVSGLNTASPVDVILDKEEYMLEELLDEEEVVQECKSLNPRLTEFLRKKENVEKLVEYLVTSPEEDADDKRVFKYPFTACEIFCCEVEGIYNTLLEHETILDSLFGLLGNARPLNTILAGYFSRVMGALLARRSGDVVQYLRKKPELLKAFVYHVDTTSVAEVLARLAGADEPVGYSESPSVLWLAETDVLALLVQSLGADNPPEGQANAAEVLAAIARSTETPLTESMASAEFMQTLVDSALAPHSGIAASHALNVCLALLEPLIIDPTMNRFPQNNLHEQLRREAVKCLSQGVDRLVSMMDPPADETKALSELKTTYGMIKPPVGQLRLKIVDLLASLFRSRDPLAEEAVMKTDSIKKAMDMFLQYPFNNALHGGVTMLITAFEEGSVELRKFLLEEVGVVDWIVSARTEVMPEPNPDAPVKVHRKPLRAGYCGHLTQIANRLQRTSEGCEYVKKFLDNSSTWKSYVENELESRNKIESVMSWQCGRPASQVMGIHGMYSTDMPFSSIECDFDSDHNRFTSPLEEDEDEDQNLTEWSAAMSKDITATETDEHTHEDISAAKVLSSVSNDVSSMEDMQDDEVLLGETDATDGLLELGAELEGLNVRDEDQTPPSEDNIVTDDGVAEKKESNGEGQDAHAFHDNQFWPKYDVPVDES